MSEIKLYKKFYSVTNNNYTLINPYALTANTYVSGTGDTESTSLIESSIPISQDSTGIYFADLDPSLYASDVTYDLVWFIKYTSTAPQKKISTRFRLNMNGIRNQIEIEIVGRY